MLGKYICLNGKFISTKDAKISLDNLEFSYGFGVYENIRLRNNKVYFLKEHLNRLLHSAKVIDLEHGFIIKTMTQWVSSIIEKNKIESANIKMLLIGGPKITPLEKGGNKQGNLYIMLLAPQYPDKKIYREGVRVITYNYERFLPEAKTLNMLPSYLAYSRAKKSGAYDALFVDSQGFVREGTRSNFFVIKNKILYTPPVQKVLDGVTRRTVIDCAKQNGYKIVERDIKLKDVFKYEGAFLTNTSGKIVPIRVVQSQKVHKVFKVGEFGVVCEEMKRLMKLYDEYIEKAT